MSRLFLLALEFLAVYGGLPLLIYFHRIPNLPIPYLLAAALVAFLLLRADPAFPLGQLSSWGHNRSYLATMLIRDAFCLVFLSLAVRLLAPDLLFSLIKRSALLWLAFFFHRYQPLFGSGWGMLVASAMAFGFVHIIFRNWLAVGLCVIGGLLFSYTYHSSGSLLLVCLDHAIFGNFLFTIGLGEFFYHRLRP